MSSELAGRIADTERALARLRTVASSAVLVQRVCDEVAQGCGFTRVLLSRVEGDTWRPWRVNDVVQHEDWFTAWEDSEIPFAELVLERTLLTERRPDVVVDAAGAHSFFQAGASASYVVAPLATGGEAIGFLHADHGLGGPACDQTDRDLLWAFGEGFTRLYERTVLLERLQDQRTRVRRTLGLVDEALERLVEAELELVTGSEDEGRPPPTTWELVEGFAALTPREQEVLAELVTGASNAQIATRLVLAPGTVKTHVKRVLAKLGAPNRAQAIARYRQAQAAEVPLVGENHPPTGEGQAGR